MWKFIVSNLFFVQIGEDYICIFSSSSLYCLRFFRCSGRKKSWVLPIAPASHKKNLLSANQAHAKPPNAKINRKILNLMDIFVSCTKRNSHSAGSNSIYDVNRRATTMVITKGTVNFISLASGSNKSKPTIASHWLAERRPNAQHNTREDILVTGNQKQGSVLGVFDVRLLPVQLWWYEPDCAIRPTSSTSIKPLSLTKVAFERSQIQRAGWGCR